MSYQVGKLAVIWCDSLESDTLSQGNGAKQENIIYSRILSLCNTGLSHPCKNVIYLFCNSVQNSKAPIANNVKTICHKLGTTKDEVNTHSVSRMKNSVRLGSAMMSAQRLFTLSRS